MADNFGLKIGVEGEREFRKALADINSQFKVLGSEMKLTTSQFESNERSVESLTSKNEVLSWVLSTIPFSGSSRAPKRQSVLHQIHQGAP